MPAGSRATPSPSTAARAFEQRYDSNGDQAGSEAKLGVGTRCSLRPVMSIVKSVRPVAADRGRT